MKQETIAYRENIQDFFDEVKGNVVHSVSYFIDSEPTFELAAVPFKFHYAHSIIIRTNNANYKISTAMAGSGSETIWVEKKSGFDHLSATFIQNINEEVLSTVSGQGFDNLCYKMELKTSTHHWIIYAAEIYDTGTDHLDYKINDEMLLIFTDMQEAQKFEDIVKERNNI